MEYRGYNIEIDGVYGYFSIKPKGRGSVPTNLRGLYTTPVIAQNDIDVHISKGEKNGKTKSSK